MTKGELLAELKGERELALTCVMTTYIVGTGYWVPRFKELRTPIDISIGSSKFQHGFQFPDPQQLVSRYTNPIDLQRDGVNIILLGLKNGLV